MQCAKLNLMIKILCNQERLSMHQFKHPGIFCYNPTGEVIIFW